MITHDNKITNPKFLKLMKGAGLSKYDLRKGEGYFYITTDDDNTIEVTDCIYVCHFSHQTPEQWVEDIKPLVAIAESNHFSKKYDMLCE